MPRTQLSYKTFPSLHHYKLQKSYFFPSRSPISQLTHHNLIGLWPFLLCQKQIAFCLRAILPIKNMINTLPLRLVHNTPVRRDIAAWSPLLKNITTVLT